MEVEETKKEILRTLVDLKTGTDEMEFALEQKNMGAFSKGLILLSNSYKSLMKIVLSDATGKERKTVTEIDFN